MTDANQTDSIAIHPLVRELLAAGEGKTLAISGHIGPAQEGRVRLYADLALRTYIELARSDIVRVLDAGENPHGPSIVLFRRDAEVTYTQTATMQADQAIAAAMAAPASPQSGCGCGGGGNDGSALARQSGGGPEISICTWACTERLLNCTRTSGTFGRLWCYFNYGFCRLGCIDPPIISI